MSRADHGRGRKRQPVAAQGLLQLRPRRLAAGEYRRPFAGERRAGAGRADQRVEAARDRRRRIDEGDRPGGKPLELVDDERKVGAGEHDMIGAPARAFDEAWRDLARNLHLLDRLAAHDAFGDEREKRRAHQRDLAIGGVIAHERVGVVARDGPARRQHADQSRSRRRRRRLDRRHGADERQARIGGPERRERQGGGGAAGDDDDIGLGFPDKARHHRLDPGDERRFAEPAVREGSVVGGIDDLDVRPEPPDFRQHREAAKSRIEHQGAGRARQRAASAPNSAIKRHSRLAGLRKPPDSLGTPYANRDRRQRGAGALTGRARFGQGDICRVFA